MKVFQICFLCMLLCVPAGLSAMETSLGTSVTLLDGILFGRYYDSIIRSYSLVDATNAGPLFSPLAGAGLYVDMYRSRNLGFGAALTVGSTGGAFAVNDDEGRLVGAGSLRELLVSAVFRVLERFPLKSVTLTASEGVVIGLAPDRITTTYRAGAGVSTVSVMPAEYYFESGGTDGTLDYAVLSFGLEGRFGCIVPLGRGSLSGLVTLGFSRIPTGLSQSEGEAFILSPGIELDYSFRVGK